MPRKNQSVLEKFFDNESMKIIVSIILGLGLASLFRKVCNNNCIVIQSPPIEDLNKYYYKIDKECFKYEPVYVECNQNN